MLVNGLLLGRERVLISLVGNVLDVDPGLGYALRPPWEEER